MTFQAYVPCLVEGLFIGVFLSLLLWKNGNMASQSSEIGHRKLLFGSSVLCAAMTFIFLSSHAYTEASGYVWNGPLTPPPTTIGYQIAGFLEGGTYTHNSIGTLAATWFATGWVTLLLYGRSRGIWASFLSTLKIYAAPMLLLNSILILIFDEREMDLQVVYPLRYLSVGGVNLASNWTALVVSASVVATFIASLIHNHMT